MNTARRFRTILFVAMFSLALFFILAGFVCRDHQHQCAPRPPHN